MTSAIEASEVLKQLEKISVAVASIQSDVADIKISQARTDERLNGLEKSLSDTRAEFKTDIADLKTDIKTDIADLKTDITDIRLQLRAQDNRLWSFVGALFLAVLGFLAKFAFFPGSQA
jgi:septal ring factor EnvC (AmiA/AmiB activator)